MDSTGIPMFLSFFPYDLPLTDGVQIDAILVQDLLHSGPIHVHDRSEVEDTLLQFNNLTDVTLVFCDLNDGEECARVAGTTAFPRLCEMNKLLFTFGSEPCW